MKFAILSDLHANRQAVEAVWAHAQEQGCEHTVLLGDFVDYGADPAWVMDFVMARHAEGATVVKGNHDDAIRHEGSHHMGSHVLASLAWTRQQLSAAHTAFIEALPLTAVKDDCLFAHANVHDPAHWGYLHGRLEATRSLRRARRAMTSLTVLVETVTARWRTAERKTPAPRERG